MSNPAQPPRSPNAKNPDALFDRVVSILEQARGNVVRAVNTSMVMAYWLIGREIVQEIQGGKGRAAYGEKLIEGLSKRLTERYRRGFSTEKLQFIRKFYLSYPERLKIPFPMGTELGVPQIAFLTGTESNQPTIGSPSVISSPSKGEGIADALGAEFRGFSPQLSWSHYRALMRVENLKARDFYEREAIAGSWDKRTLERQIQTQYYDRCLHSQQPERMIADGRRLQKAPPEPSELLKNPYVLEFLGYPNFAELRESEVEQSIINHLQRFLLGLGTGFAFVARQKHIRIEEEDRFIDLVFYHCRLKFYLLIDLKISKLTHGDVGQMDGYVRMFDGLVAAPDDNPTIGLILCTEKNETVARYSVLNDRKQIFASKYILCLPTEEQLRLEIARERRLIESKLEEQADA